MVNSDIEQIVEMREEGDRFLRLLELLGEWYERGKVIVFVHSQDKCDQVVRDLLRSGYPCLSLHGGKEQSDRECTIADFKSDVCNILIATSAAARWTSKTSAWWSTTTPPITSRITSTASVAPDARGTRAPP